MGQDGQPQNRLQAMYVTTRYVIYNINNILFHF